jgi:hypothetical protein
MDTRLRPAGMTDEEQVLAPQYDSHPELLAKDLCPG